MAYRAFVAMLGAALLISHSSLRKIAVIEVSGPKGQRFDYLTIDAEDRYLLSAHLGPGILYVVDMRTNKLVKAIPGLPGITGLEYVPGLHKVYTSNWGEEKIGVVDLRTMSVIKRLPTESKPNGYGGGALGEFDQEGTKLADIKLDAHPESFQFEKNGSRIFVNLPGSRKIAVVDRKTRSVSESWGTGGPLANYPMALDQQNHRLFVVTRFPARLIVLDTVEGKRVAALSAIGDCDDVFYDEQRHRIYAIGGEGGISVFQQRDSDPYDELSRIKTVSGARTGFFSVELDKLYVAVRKHGSQDAEIRVYRPTP